MAAPLGSLGKYEVRGTLGRGAMGTVHDGWDPAIDRRVAIKTVRLPEGDDPETQESLSRFKREAQAAGRLSHPNIVGVFDYGETADLAYIVMEFVDGATLKDRLDADERLPVPETLRIMADVLAGLSYSHARGVVHRDIKPANIMLTADGQAKIADFGIARIESSSMTQAGTVLGTPAYMSPEQFMGQVVDRRTDIYSTGVLLYVLLTGEKPFDGGLTAIMHKALNTTPPKPSELSVTAPPHLDAVVARAMARRPEDRFPDADSFAAALRGAGAAPVAEPHGDATLVMPRPRPAPATPVAPPKPAPARRSNVPVLAGAGVAVLVLGGVAAWLLLPGTPAPTRTVAITPTPITPPRPPEPLTTPPQPDPPQPNPPQPDPPQPNPPQQASPRVEPPIVTPPQPVITQPTPSLPGGSTFIEIGRTRIGPGGQPGPTTPTPTPTPTPPPPQQQAALVLPPPPAVRSPAAIRAALATPLADTRCTLATAEVGEGGQATISGLAGAGEPEATLRREAERAAPATWRVTPFTGVFNGPFCRALDILRPFGPNAGDRMRLALAGNRTALSDNDQIVVGVAMPDIAGHLHVAYLQNDGLAANLVPGPAYPPRTYAAGSTVELGRARADFPDGWRVGVPFGTDMIVAVVSSAPLFAQPRPPQEPSDLYLRDLQSAIETLRRRGGTVAADAVVFETRP